MSHLITQLYMDTTLMIQCHGENVAVKKEGSSEEKLLEIALEAGAEDLQVDGDLYSIYTPLDTFEEVKRSIEAAGIEIEESSLTMIPQTEVHVEGKVAGQLLNLMEALEDHDDVQNVFANFDIDEAELESLAS